VEKERHPKGRLSRSQEKNVYTKYWTRAPQGIMSRPLDWYLQAVTQKHRPSQPVFCFCPDARQVVTMPTGVTVGVLTAGICSVSWDGRRLIAFREDILTRS
jgi:hypothetical protein